MGESVGAPVEAVSSGRPPANRTVRILGAAVAVLGVLIVVLLVLLLANRESPAAEPSASPTPTPSATPSTSPTPAPSPSPTPTVAAEAPTAPEEPPPPPPPPAPTGPVFTSFSAPSKAGCDGDSGSVEMTFTWSTSKAVKAWFGIATTNAKAAPYEDVSVQAGSYTAYYQCSEASQVYTVTIEDADGKLTHETRTISRN